MAPSSFSPLLRYLSQSPKPFIYHRHYRLFALLKHFSLFPPSHSTSTSTSTSSEPSKPSSLTSRLSFVFDKIDEIEKERSEKDDALQRIRAWRESKKKNQQDGSINDVENEKLGLGFSEADANGGEEMRNVDAIEGGEKKVGLMKREIELAHPWPEWVGLMERLVQQNYFDHKRKDEDRMIESFESIGVAEFAENEGFDFTRDWKTVQSAIVNFGKDRFDILRSISRKDIQTLVGYGCPSADKKVVFSAKLLRKHAHLDEGDVCSSCILRNNCERAYLVTNKEDEARTIDMMRILLTYGFDPINGSVENKSLLKHKSVKSVVRKLLHEIVRLSAVPIDPNLPPPVIKKRPPKVKQPPPPPKRRVGRDDIEMKKGDWLCPKCNFMNFAKNVVCLQCDAKRPKRELLPGEWECPQCNFLNYRRNMTCFNCEHKRPPDEYMENQMHGRQQRSNIRQERPPDREQLSNAWNFDFDDDESDGADVAAFEYADTHATNEDDRLDSPLENGSFGRPQENLHKVGRTSRYQEKEPPRPVHSTHTAAFDDFDDDDDDIDSYEIDNQNRSPKQEASSLRFSDVENEGYSDAEEDDLPQFSQTRSSSYPKPSRSSHREGSLSDLGDHDLDFDSDEDLPVHSKWKSSHVADSGRKNKSLRSPSNRLSFGSDDDDRLVFGSEDDIEESHSRQRPKKYYDSDESDPEQGEKSHHNRKRSGLGGNFSENNDFVGFDRSSRGSRGSQRDLFDGQQNMGRGPQGRQRDLFNKRGKQSMSEGRGSHGSQRGSFDNARERQSTSGRQRAMQNSNGSRQSQRGMQNFNGSRKSRDHEGRRSNNSDNWSELDRPLRQQRNIR
ncbi:unnamed protein product [Amaranthus hypochondriacus]